MPIIQDPEWRVQKPLVVLVDSQPASARQTVAALMASGYQCKTFTECAAALATLRETGADVIIADYSTDRSAADLIQKVRAHSPETALVLMVSNPAVAAAVAAVRQGAFDYLTKPINPDELATVVGKALEMAALRRENRLLHEQLDVASMAAAFIAESASSRTLAATIRRAAPASAPVLIEGESGTGKELVARMLHHWSSRAQGPFVKVSFKSFGGSDPSAGISASLQPAQAGAASMLSEYAERAIGGTLFLDEISEAAPEFQSALLRLIGDGEHRGYGNSPRTSGVRIVASTNRPFAYEVAGGRIRPDLYFALNVISIQIAPLRKRPEDIMPLARHFLALHAAETGRALVLTPDAERALLAHAWPGNVRELENIVERAVVMSSSERISEEALMIRPAVSVDATSSPLPPHKPPVQYETANLNAVDEDAEDERAAAEPAAGGHEAGAEYTFPMDGTLQEFLDSAAAIRIKKAIDGSKGNRNAAATALGIDRTTLYRLMRRLGL